MSVRWFVPLLVPGFWLLARLLSECPSFRADFLVLTGWGLVLGYQMWQLGPWMSGPVGGQGETVGRAVLMWAAVRGALVARWVWRGRAAQGRAEN